MSKNWRRSILGMTLAIASAMPVWAQNIGGNAGIWWNPTPGQPAAFTLLNPLSTVYGRVGFMRVWHQTSNIEVVGNPGLGWRTIAPDGWGGALGIGVRLMPVLRYELQLAGAFNSTVGIQVAGVPPLGVAIRRSSVQLMNNLYLDTAPFFANGLWGFNPYVFGGIGVAWNSTGDMLDPNSNILNGVFTSAPGSGTTRTAFAWNVGGGIQYQPLRNLIVDLAYRYVDAGRFHLNASPLVAPALPNALNFRATSHQLMVSVIVPVDGLIRGFGN